MSFTTFYKGHTIYAGPKRARRVWQRDTNWAETSTRVVERSDTPFGPDGLST